MKAIYCIIAFLVSTSMMSVTLMAQTQALPPLAASSANSDPVSEIARIRERWVRHWNAGQLQAVLESYAPDAVLLPANGQRIAGREDIAKYFQQVMDSGVRLVSLESVACDAAGSLAYDSGRLKYTTGGAAPDQPNQVTPSAAIRTAGRQVEGNYLVVLRREKDGRWLIVQHAFTEAVMKSLLEDKRPLVQPDPLAPVPR